MRPHTYPYAIKHDSDTWHAERREVGGPRLSGNCLILISPTVETKLIMMEVNPLCNRISCIFFK